MGLFGAPNAATLEEKITPPCVTALLVVDFLLSRAISIHLQKHLQKLINTNIKISGYGIWTGNLVCFREIDSIAGKLIGY